jgi:hypothetical protein
MCDKASTKTTDHATQSKDGYNKRTTGVSDVYARNSIGNLQDQGDGALANIG